MGAEIASTPVVLPAQCGIALPLFRWFGWVDTPVSLIKSRFGVSRGMLTWASAAFIVSLIASLPLASQWDSPSYSAEPDFSPAALASQRRAASAEAPRSSDNQAVLAGDLEAGDTMQLTGLQGKFEAIARKVSPAVVAISASVQAVDSGEALRGQDLNAERLEAMLDHTTRMVGTGFIIDSEGYILTNEHVVGEAESVWITTDDRKVYPAIEVGSDPRSYLAVLKIPASHLPTVHFAPYNSVKRGQWSIAIGNPYGLATEGEACMSVGIISALDRSLPRLARKENRLYSSLIQTTAQINPGNSGGPLFDLNGDVIGINTAVILPEKKTNGIGFALPISPQLMACVRDIKEGKEVVYGYLGVMVSTASEHDRRQAGIEHEMGVHIDSIEPDSPAAGTIKENDMVVQINGEPVGDTDQFVRAVGSAPINQATLLTIYRSGKVQNLTVTLRRRQIPSLAVTRDSRRFRWQGLLLGSVPDHWDKSSKSIPGEAPALSADTAASKSDDAPVRARSGLMVLAIAPRSPFAQGDNVHQGDIITAVAGRPVGDVVDIQKILNEQPANKCELTIAGKQRVAVLVND